MTIIRTLVYSLCPKSPVSCRQVTRRTNDDETNDGGQYLVGKIPTKMKFLDKYTPNFVSVVYFATGHIIGKETRIPQIYDQYRVSTPADYRRPQLVPTYPQSMPRQRGPDLASRILLSELSQPLSTTIFNFAPH